MVEEIFTFMEKLPQDGTPILLVEQNMRRAAELVRRFYALERRSVVLKSKGDDASHRVALVQQLNV